MKRFFILLVFFISKISFSQIISVVKIADLQKRINVESDTTYIVNFWATWCAPCVKELPDFDSIQIAYKDKNVKVLLVTLDFLEDLENKVIPFVKRKNVTSEVMLLDEVNGNYFIPKISNDWTGAIPATLILNKKKDKRFFFENKLDYNFLKNIIEEINTIQK